MGTEQEVSALSLESVVEDVLHQQEIRLSDRGLASRKAEEASSRRYEAVRWLRKTVGVVGGKDLPAEPSEEEFRLGLRSGIILCNVLNRVQPGAVPKVVEGPSDSAAVPDGAALSVFQYFENVRNFLVAVEEMGLPTFEASDLEKGGKSARIVNSVLALKAYSDWKDGGGSGSWKLGGNSKPVTSGKHFVRRSSEQLFMNSYSRATSTSEQTSHEDPSHDLSQAAASGSFHMLIRQILSEKKQEDIPIILESIISKAMEEFECRFASQNVSRMKAEPEDSTLCSSKPLLEDSTLWCSSKPLLEDSTLCSSKPLLEDSTCSSKPLLETSSYEDFKKEEETEEIAPESSLEELKSEEEMEDKAATSSSEDLKEEEEKKEKEENFLKIMATAKILNKDLEEKVAQNKKLTGQILKHESFVKRQEKDIQELKQTLSTTKEQMLLLQVKYREDFGTIGKQMYGLAHAASGYQKVLEENRKLYNQVQDLKGNIRVYCRVRPFLPGQPNSVNSVGHLDDGSITILTPSKNGKDAKKSFTFNRVFSPSATQAEVFSDTQPLVRSVLDGYNVCIFAYGQTGSGKTHTMSGPKEITEEGMGVNYRALNDLFSISKQRKDSISYDIRVQMIEIYNEQVRDLLSTDGSIKKLEIRNNSSNGINVPEANLVPVSTTSDVIHLMNLGQRNRAVSATAMNDRSSRSHSCLTVHIQGKDLTSGTVLRGCMHLVDLAGSERVDKSEVVGDRLKEAVHINKSLSALGDVISSLAQKSQHVPYRNSKLTQLLQDSLGGQAKTLMFVHISPEPHATVETISTLKFAERVSSIELGAAKVNKDTSEVKELKEQIASLKEALARKDAEEDIHSQSSSPDRSGLKSGGSSCSNLSWQGTADEDVEGIHTPQSEDFFTEANQLCQSTTPKIAKSSLGPKNTKNTQLKAAEGTETKQLPRSTPTAATNPSKKASNGVSPMTNRPRSTGSQDGRRRNVGGK